MLRSTAALLAGGAVGAGVTSGIDTARAAETQLSVAGDEVTVRNGSIEALWLTLGVEWAYDVPSGERPETVVVEVLAGESESDMESVATAESGQAFLEASGTESFEVDLVDAGVVSADALVPSEGGQTAETTVHVGAEMRLEDENGMVIAADSQTDTATVAVTKSAYDPQQYGAVGGSGELTVDVQ